MIMQINIFYLEYNMIGNQDESDQDVLQPISIVSPPNQLIGSQYSADQKPVLKLMKFQRPRYSQSCHQLRKQYKTLFNNCDTLGYQLSLSLITNMVYLKLNNHNYMTYKTRHEQHKYLSGLFLNKKQLLCPEVQKSKNIYKVLEGIEYVEYESLHRMEHSFGLNSKLQSCRDVKFSSNYDTANLFIALKKKHNQYDLILQNDLNSKGNTQWFNFIVQLPEEGTYSFNIINFTKSYSQYQDGMRILYHSSKDEDAGYSGWARGGSAISYTRNSIKREDCDSKRYYTLKFQYTNSYTYDKVAFASFYPYSGLQLQKYLKKVMNHRKINLGMKIQKIKICQTLSGLPVYALSIQYKKHHSSLSTKSTFNIRTSLKLNKSVIFMARQHPGETQGSFLIEGIIDFLLETGEMDYLKKNISYYIFPMINPDGVLYGNYRTNLAGTDLNRVWRQPRKDLHPEVSCIKKYLDLINRTSPISMIIDLHGHSKSLNSFFYGNPPKKQMPSLTEDPRIFPYFCSKKIKQLSFRQCTFSSCENKKNSARIVLSESFPKALVYTLQNSFHGWKRDRNIVVEYTPEILRNIGRDLINSYLQFERLLEKNPQIRDKWLKEILDLSIQNSDDGDSDSQAAASLISRQQGLQEPQQSRPREILIQNPTSQVRNFLKQQSKQNFIQRNMMVKYNAQKRFTRYQKHYPDIEANGFQKKAKQKKPWEFRKYEKASSQGFLSIIKIKGKQEKDFNHFRNEPTAEGDIRFKFTKQNIMEKLKNRKLRMEEKINDCSGMLSFLRTMGIPLDKKGF